MRITVCCKVNYFGPVKMTAYILRDYSIGYSASGSDIVVEFTLKRRIEQHLLTTFLPSLCILVCAQVTLSMPSSHTRFVREGFKKKTL